MSGDRVAEATRAGLPFELPAEPVDGYEIKLWKFHRYYAKVMPWSAVYHVNSTWKQAFPDWEDGYGAPFVNQWLIRLDGAFEERGPESWTWAYEWDEYFRHLFRTAEEARAHGRALMTSDLEKNQVSIERLHAQLASLKLQELP